MQGKILVLILNNLLQRIGVICLIGIWQRKYTILDFRRNKICLPKATIIFKEWVSPRLRSRPFYWGDEWGMVCYMLLTTSSKKLQGHNKSWFKNWILEMCRLCQQIANACFLPIAGGGGGAHLPHSTANMVPIAILAQKNSMGGKAEDLPPPHVTRNTFEKTTFSLF